MALRTGSWGTWELGLTEGLADLFGLARNAQGGSQLKGTYDTGSTAIYKDQDTGSRGTLNELYPKTPVVLGDSTQRTTTGGGNGSTPSSSIQLPDNGNAEQRAQDERARTLSAIQARLDETRRLAKDKISRATEDRDYITNTVLPRFDDLITRANDRRTTQLNDLGEEEVKTQNLYDKAAAQARRRTESAALKNRLVARAGNRLGSSFYDDLVSGNQENLIRTLGENDVERLDKVGAIGKRKTETERYFDETTKDIENQKTDASNEAIRSYKEQVAAAEALDRAGVLDFGEGVAQAESTLSSRLDQIDQWAKNVALKRMELDAIYGKGNTAVNSYEAFDEGLNTKLANNAGLNSTNAYTADTMGAGNQTDQGALAQILALTQQPKKRETTLADLLARVGGSMTPSYAPAYAA